MVYLIGTNHELQHNAKPRRGATAKVIQGRRDFADLLANTLSDTAAQVLAEESSREVMEALDTTSTIEELAAEKGVRHIYADMDRATRDKKGMPVSGTKDLPAEQKRIFHAVREEYWLEHIKSFVSDSVVFVCGAEHVGSFSKLLRYSNVPVTVLEEYWGAEIYGT